MKFQGENKASISERSDYGYGCILTTYGKIKNRLETENICISDTTVRPRKDTYLFDFDCVNEVILSALVYNDWTILEPQISMFHDRLKILYHGGLPSGMTEKLFFDGISKPRNVALMRIFLNIVLTEHIGHGIPTIVDKYGTEVFEIQSNYMRCTIPFDKEMIAQIDNKNDALNKTKNKVIELLIVNPSLTSIELAEQISVTKRTIGRTFKSLYEKKMIDRIKPRRGENWIVVR